MKEKKFLLTKSTSSVDQQLLFVFKCILLDLENVQWIYPYLTLKIEFIEILQSIGITSHPLARYEYKP